MQCFTLGSSLFSALALALLLALVIHRFKSDFGPDSDFDPDFDFEGMNFMINHVSNIECECEYECRFAECEKHDEQGPPLVTGRESQNIFSDSVGFFCYSLCFRGSFVSHSLV